MKTKNLLLSLTLLASTMAAAQSWEVIPNSSQNSIQDMHVYSEDIVFFFGENSTFIKTYDGGITLDIHELNGSVYSAGFAKSADTLFLANGFGSIKRSVNGGSTWTSVDESGAMVNEIIFSEDNIGLYAGLSGVFRSANGGAIWSSSPVTPIMISNKIVSLNNGIYLVKANTDIYRSIDGGSTFSIVDIAETGTAPFTDIAFYNNQGGYAITTDGQLFHTENAGLTWTLVIDLPSTTARNMTWIDQNNGYLQVDFGTVSKINATHDGGLTWALEYTTTSLINHFEGNGQTIYGCGDAGLIIKKSLSTGITEKATPQIEAWPNPTDGYIHIRGIQVPTDYIIIDALGKEISKSTLSKSSATIDISQLQSGIYYIGFPELGNSPIRIVRD